MDSSADSINILNSIWLRVIGFASSKVNLNRRPFLDFTGHIDQIVKLSHLNDPT